MITVFLFLCIVIVFMHFAHELEKKLSTMYNYTAIQTEQEDPKLFATVKTHKQTCLKRYLSQKHNTEAALLRKPSFYSPK